LDKPKFKLTQDHIKPEYFVPLGDRYLIKLLEVDDSLKLEGGQTLFVPGATEKDRGWKAGVVVAKGNGHRLIEGDKVAVIPNKLSAEDMKAIEGGDRSKVPAGAQYATEEAVVVRPPSVVAMFFGLGEVVIVERFAGRDFKLGPSSHEYCTISQDHILGSIKGLQLFPNSDGEWREMTKKGLSVAPALGANVEVGDIAPPEPMTKESETGILEETPA
jgi:co-chaperonin GroES (HSP10)